MRFPTTSALFALFSVPTLLAAASDASHWSSLAAKSKTGVIKLDSASYDDILSPDREYSVLVVLTALPAQFKCQPCHEFDPSFQQVAASWKRQPQHIRDQHFFAQLDFSDGQAIYQRLGLSSAPTVQFHPAQTGPNKSNKLSVVTHDLNRQGLGVNPLHAFISPLTPAPFELYKPFNPLPFILVPLTLIGGGLALYALGPVLLPIIQSRIIWGVVSVVLILTFTSGYMWNRIRSAPYVAAGPDGKVNWIAQGFQSQLGLESQVVAGIYGLLAFSIVALTAFVPAQSSPTKQRIGVYLWLGMLVVVFSILMRLFKFKNGGYPFGLLF